MLQVKNFKRECYNFSIINKLLLLVIAVIFAIPSTVNAQVLEEYLAFEILPPSLFGIPRMTLNHFPGEIIDFNGKAAFKQSSYPAILWVSDGTIEGTTKISFPEWDNLKLENNRIKNYSAVIGNKLFFTVEINKKKHIWATDGTQEGTHEVTSPSTTGYHTFNTLKAFDDWIVFTAYVNNDEPNAVFLINEDGTEAQKNNNLSFLSGSTTSIGNDLYGVQADGGDRHIVKFDKQGITTQLWHSSSFNSIGQLNEANGKIFFVGNQGEGSALWIFDPNSATATRIFNPSKEAKSHQGVRSLTVVGDKVYYFSNFWDEDLNNGNGDFSFDNRLYISDGTSVGSHQIWSTSLLGNSVDNHNANNNPIAAAGDRILFVALHSTSSDYIYFGAGTTSSSIEVIETDGRTFSANTTDPDPSPVRDGAWFTTGKNLIFTDGTTEGTYSAPGKEIFIPHDKVGIINDRPWFVADYKSIGMTKGIWRALPLNEWNPTRPFLLEPKTKSTSVSTTPTFTWDKVVNTDSYHFQLSEQSDFSELTFSNEAIEDTTLTFNNSLVGSTKYYWRVLAQNADTTGEWSDVYNFTTKQKKPNAPILAKPENNKENMPLSSNTRYSWGHVEGTTSYQLQISVDSNFQTTFIDKSATYSWSFVDTTYAANTTHYWRVKAINNDQESDWSEVWSFTTVEEKPIITDLISPTNDTVGLNLNPVLYWGSIDNAKSYTVELAKNEMFVNAVLDTSQIVADSLHISPPLDYSTKYYWRVRAENTAGSGKWSEAWSFTTKAYVSNELTEAPVEFTLQQNYPNPFNPTTQIQYGIKEAIDVKLTIFNMLGQEVAILVNEKKSAGWHTVTFDAAGFSSGFYIYRIQAGSFIDTKKLMMIK